MAFILAVPFTLVIWYSPHLFSLLGEDHEVVRLTALFLHGLALGVFATSLALSLRFARRFRSKQPIFIAKPLWGNAL